jgi:hypothetical protein
MTLLSGMRTILLPTAGSRSWSARKRAGAAEAAAEYLLKGREMFHFRDPDGVRMQIYPSAAGRVPVITFRDTEDFENLAVSAAYGGKRPENLSRMGAIFLYNKSDRFIMLSSKPYSNVPAEELGLAEDDWAEKSMKIRLEHECTHYFTKQFFGSAANNLHDELIADFFGLENAFGFYKAEYFLRFLGLTGKSGGRFQVYLESLPEEVREEIRPLLEEIVREGGIRRGSLVGDASLPENGSGSENYFPVQEKSGGMKTAAVRRRCFCNNAGYTE